MYRVRAARLRRRPTKGLRGLEQLSTAAPANSRSAMLDVLELDLSRCLLEVRRKKRAMSLRSETPSIAAV